MEEQKVTVDGETHAVPQPFMVIATQNPIEQLGTYKLPEAQMDRFLIKTTIGYPSHDVSVNILKQVNVIDRASTVHAVLTGNDVLRMRAISETVRLDDAIIEYIVRLVEATRHNERIQVGSSMPRRARTDPMRPRVGRVQQSRIRGARRCEATGRRRARTPHHAHRGGHIRGIHPRTDNRTDPQ